MWGGAWLHSRLAGTLCMCECTCPCVCVCMCVLAEKSLCLWLASPSVCASSMPTYTWMYTHAHKMCLALLMWTQARDLTYVYFSQSLALQDQNVPSSISSFTQKRSVQVSPGACALSSEPEDSFSPGPLNGHTASRMRPTLHVDVSQWGRFTVPGKAKWVEGPRQGGGATSHRAKQALLRDACLSSLCR